MFDNETEKKQGIILLERILKLAFAIIAIEGIVGFFIMPLSAYILFVGGLIFLLALTIIAWLLLKQQQFTQGATVFLLALWVSFSLLTIFNGGVRSPAPTTFIFGVLVAGLLLGDKAARGFAALSALTTAVIYLLEIGWGLPPTPLLLTATSGLFAFSLLLSAITAVYSLTIRKLHQTIQALSASEAEMRAIFQAMNDTVFVMDRDGRYTKIASTSSPNLLTAQADMLHKTVYDMLPVEQATQLHSYNKQVLTTQQPAQVEYSLPNGKPNWYEANIAPLSGREAMWIVRDITGRKQTEKALRHSEANLKEAQHIAKLGDFEFDLSTQNVHWSDEVYRIFGVPIGEKITLDQYQSSLTVEDFERVMAVVETAVTSQQSYTLEHDIILDNGQRKHLFCVGRPIVNSHGQVKRIFGIVQDRTESKQIEQALRESNVRYQALFDNAYDAIWVYNLDDKVIAANVSACELSGYPLAEILGRTPDFFTVPEEFDQVYQRWQEIVVEGEIPPVYERTLVHKDGHHLICEIRARRIDDEAGKPLFFQGVVRDVTTRKESEAKIRASLQEKEVLLKEIHHRVKNNLQVISSLLDLQSGYINDERIKEMFQESQSRVRSMALVHEQLYQSDDLARINFAEYVHKLADYLQQVYGQVNSCITLVEEIENVPLSVDTAVPLGLIVNELVSNAYKHAFKDGRSGQITIQLQADSPAHYRLTVQDNGKGMPFALDFRQASSLGLTIVLTLVDQLNGHIELSREQGTRFEIAFPLSDGAY